jgi:hypothetical protein
MHDYREDMFDLIVILDDLSSLFFKGTYVNEINMIIKGDYYNYIIKHKNK